MILEVLILLVFVGGMYLLYQDWQEFLAWNAIEFDITEHFQMFRPAMSKHLQESNDSLTRYGLDYESNGILEHMPHLRCKDGLKMSVQASAMHYCSPRNSQGPWHEFEVGFPNRPVPEFNDFVEDPDRPCDTVYAWVPAHLINEVVKKAGGLLEE